MTTVKASSSTSSASAEGPRTFCLICVRQLPNRISSAASPSNSVSESPETEWLKHFSTCMELAETVHQNNTDFSCTSIGFCFECRTTLEEWKHSHDQEIRWRLKARQLKATLTANLVESFQHPRETEKGRESNDNSQFDKIRSDIMKQYHPTISLEKLDPVLSSTTDEAAAPGSISGDEIVCGQCKTVFQSVTDPDAAVLDHFCSVNEGNDDLEVKHEIVGNEIDHHLSMLRNNFAENDLEDTECGTDSASGAEVLNLPNTIADGMYPIRPRFEVASLVKEEEETSSGTAQLESESAEQMPHLQTLADFPVAETTQSSTVSTEDINFRFNIEATHETPSQTSNPSASKPQALEHSPAQSIATSKINSRPIRQNSSSTAATKVASKSKKANATREPSTRAREALELYLAVISTDTKNKYGLKYYRCGKCGKTFITKAELKTHIFGAHGGLFRWSKSVSPAGKRKYLYFQKVPFSLSKDGTYTCGVCRYAASVNQTAYRHILLKHFAYKHAEMLHTEPETSNNYYNKNTEGEEQTRLAIVMEEDDSLPGTRWHQAGLRLSGSVTSSGQTSSAEIPASNNRDCSIPLNQAAKDVKRKRRRCDESIKSTKRRPNYPELNSPLCGFGAINDLIITPEMANSVVLAASGITNLRGLVDRAKAMKKKYEAGNGGLHIVGSKLKFPYITSES